MIWGYPHFRKPPNGFQLKDGNSTVQKKTEALCSFEYATCWVEIALAAWKKTLQSRDISNFKRFLVPSKPSNGKSSDYNGKPKSMLKGNVTVLKHVRTICIQMFPWNLSRAWLPICGCTISSPPAMGFGGTWRQHGTGAAIGVPIHQTRL